MGDRRAGEAQIELAPTGSHGADEMGAGEQQRSPQVALQFGGADGQLDELALADRIAIGIERGRGSTVGQRPKRGRALGEGELAMVGAQIESQAQRRCDAEQRQLGVRACVVERRRDHPRALIAQDREQALLLVAEPWDEQRLSEGGVACRTIVLAHRGNTMTTAADVSCPRRPASVRARCQP